ncbi:hypothetical protein [Antrihabitans sp. YC2-6]|uniref:hypothetical protein n=1 Tax=Antrihabitans sp. YC2-6 TaxID=2799498 RepID=UPI0018F691AD|nr:hypothetical protein [Antrihabitans sp. YC2-6]MBJ8345863.1 hypothetical protein [Antrihabitans sp. YC2-6]
MSFWLTALAVWIAAGARVGRVLVRPATTVRLAIVVAVAAVAAAVTIAIPEVAVTVDRVEFARDGHELSARLQLAMWVVFAAGGSVVAAAAWPITSRNRLRRKAAAIYSGGLVVGLATLFATTIVGWIALLLATAFIMITGLRSVDWTPLGRGVALFTAGTTIIAVLAAGRAASLIRGREEAQHPGPTWAWSLAALLVSVGAVWILVEVWFRARLLMRRVRQLHADLTKRFPEVANDDPEHSTTVLKASDQVAQIMDALYLQAGGGGIAPLPTAPPPDGPRRASAVAAWVHDPLNADPVDTQWIAPPAGMSTRRWVGDIAAAYDKVGEK